MKYRCQKYTEKEKHDFHRLKSWPAKSRNTLSDIREVYTEKWNIEPSIYKRCSDKQELEKEESDFSHIRIIIRESLELQKIYLSPLEWYQNLCSIGPYQTLRDMHVMAHNNDAQSGDIYHFQQMHPLYHLSAYLGEQMTTLRANEDHLNERPSLTERYMCEIFLKHT